MKSIIGIIGILAFSGVAQAEPNYEMCGKLSTLASNVMDARQSGVPMKDLIEPSDPDFAKTMILMAYEESRWNSEKHRQLAISDFADKVYKDCITATDKD